MAFLYDLPNDSKQIGQGVRLLDKSKSSFAYDGPLGSLVRVAAAQQDSEFGVAREKLVDQLMSGSIGQDHVAEEQIKGSLFPLKEIQRLFRTGGPPYDVAVFTKCPRDKFTDFLIILHQQNPFTSALKSLQ